MFCFQCLEQGENFKQCSRCKVNIYCSVRCQTQHWKRHKKNCLPPDSEVHQLFRVCAEDLIPASNNPIWWQFGFANVLEYHGWSMSREGLTPLQILLGIYQAIRIDVSLDEDPIPITPPGNTMGMSKKMLQKAYKSNTLDDLLHRFITNSISNRGNSVAKYLFWWQEQKLVIGPTRPTLSNMVEWHKVMEKMRKDIYIKYYEH